MVAVSGPSPLLNFQVAVNHLLRRIWRLPRTVICHCLSQVPAIRKRHYTLYSSAMSSSSPLVKAVYSSSSFLPFTFTGYNFIFGSRHIKLYSDH